MYLLLALVPSGKSATHLLVTHLGPCDNVPLTIVTLKEMSITTQAYDSTLSGAFNISEDIENGWQVTARIQKCLDIRNIDSCDHYKTVRIISNGCSEAEDEEETLSLLFHYTAPEIECPIQAGEYNLVNYPFFTEDIYFAVLESKISNSVFGYIYILEGLTADSRKLFCVEIYLQLLYVREHNWLGKTTATGSPKKEENNEEEEENSPTSEEVDEETSNEGGSSFEVK